MIKNIIFCWLVILIGVLYEVDINYLKNDEFYEKLFEEGYILIRTIIIFQIILTISWYIVGEYGYIVDEKISLELYLEYSNYEYLIKGTIRELIVTK